MPGTKQERRIWKEETLRLHEINNPLEKAPLKHRSRRTEGASVPAWYLRESEKASTPYLEMQ